MSVPAAPNDPALPIEGHMVLRNLKYAGFSNSTVAGLVTALNTFTAGLAEETYLRTHFVADGAVFAALVEYVD